MKKFVTRCGNITTTAVLTLWCCLAQADDIEVYVSQASGGSPVALLVIDTSGSMRAEVVVDTPDYEPSTNYKEIHKKKPDGDNILYPFDPTLYYFDNNYSPAGKIDSDDVTRLTKRPFPPAALACSRAIEKIKNYGSYTQKFKRWNADQKRWYPRRGGGGMEIYLKAILLTKQHSLNVKQTKVFILMTSRLANMLIHAINLNT